MKCLLLLFFAASIWEDASALPSDHSAPAPVDSALYAIGSVPIAADKAAESVLSPSELYYSHIAQDKDYTQPLEYNYGRREQQWIDGNQYNNRQRQVYPYGRRDQNDRRDHLGNIYKGVYQDSIFDGKDYRDMFWIPKLPGRHGLGFQKRNYYATGMRFPNTPDIQEPIGNRPLVKQIKYEPLEQYNY